LAVLTDRRDPYVVGLVVVADADRSADLVGQRAETEKCTKGLFAFQPPRVTRPPREETGLASGALHVHNAASDLAAEAFRRNVHFLRR
jgi:hypothetical protein